MRSEASTDGPAPPPETKQSRVGKAIYSVLGIDPQDRYRYQPTNLTDIAKDTIDPAGVFVEEEPTVTEWLKQLKPTRAASAEYVRSLFPAATWVGRYNWRWLVGDMVAGLTIGFVVVPQAMAYALLARLSPEYGLYTSFVGAALYWLFGTSRDIVIGTTAVGSLLVGQVVTNVEQERPGVYSPEDIAKTLSLLSGCVLLFVGITRLGWLIELIPYIPISAFVTAASITIMSTQIPVALGITGINTRDAPYLVIINTLKGLPRIKVDAAIGLSCIVMLFIIRDACTAMEKRQPSRKRMWSSISSLRQVFAMLLYTLISFLVHRTMPRGESKFRIVGEIESGFTHAGVPSLDKDLVVVILPKLPAVVIILVIEHIAIAKSFGRIFNYTINPSQEIIAQGAANLFGPFVGGYVCTGSFGASAVLSKAGVRTPFAGLFSALILILALYALTAVFYYIPMAALAGLIIHAVSNLLAEPKALYKYWQLSPFELLIWVVGVVLALFESLEVSIYTTIVLSAALLLVRLSRSRGRFLGRATVREAPTKECSSASSGESLNCSSSCDNEFEPSTFREAFLPIDREDGSNPAVRVMSPHPGIFIYRFTEGFNYTNQAHHIAALQKHILDSTMPSRGEHFEHQSDRLWCDPGLKATTGEGKSQPVLRAIVLDCSAVNNIDITSIQGLIDLRNTLDRYAAPDPVDWHFSQVYNRWSRRSLAVAGFGYPSSLNPDALGNWKPAYTIAAVLAQEDSNETLNKASEDEEEGKGGPKKPAHVSVEPMMATIDGVDRPFFHIDLIGAVSSAVRNARRRDMLDAHRNGVVTE